MDVVWQSLVTSGALALLAVPAARYFYVRFYLSRRLYFERWTNLSRNDKLDLGDSLAELLFFELEAIRKLLNEAKSDPGLWNEKSGLPALERSFDGYPEFVRHAELLGLSGQLSKLLRLVLLTKPPSVRGTIHEYGSTVRFQLVLSRLRGEIPDRCLTATCEAGKPDLIPDAVAELAHGVVVELGNEQGFKSPQTFRYFTTGLRHHLAYNSLKRDALLEQAEEMYRLAIEHEGGNAESSCNLGDLLYSQFTYEANERAILSYLGALRTNKPVLRARAFRGLANAYCQREQRHKRGGIAALEGALRWARFASELCREASKDLPNEEKASVKKADAYAHQVWAELGCTNNDAERNKAYKRAVDLYQEATSLNDKFTVAYNNLGYLYLTRAERTLKVCCGKSGAELEDLRANAAGYLREAERECQKAIEKDRAFHMAYDNKGNISVSKGLIEDNLLESHLRQAVECYHQAISYQPAYREAYADLARTHSELFRVSTGECRNGLNSPQQHHASLAWQHHWDALTYTSDPTGRQNICTAFKKYGLPQTAEVVARDDRARATGLNRTCLAREVGA